jgi:gamma-butyrobetaine dioxygenase
MRPPAASVDEVVALYEKWGRDPYDEELSQLEHAEQTAALAVTAGADDALVAAGLLHDACHLLDLQDRNGEGGIPSADLHHEASGAAWLASLFPPSVTAPIALHVRAKRYRCAVEPDYLAGLSHGSTASLEKQGGPLNRDEALAFEANPGFEGAVQLRGWDDGGKVDGLPVPAFDTYRELLDRLAR